jgi:hypothetical protein
MPSILRRADGGRGVAAGLPAASAAAWVARVVGVYDALVDCVGHALECFISLPLRASASAGLVYEGLLASRGVVLAVVDLWARGILQIDMSDGITPCLKRTKPTYIFVLHVVDINLQAWIGRVVGSGEPHGVLWLSRSTAQHLHIHAADVRLGAVGVGVVESDELVADNVISSFEITGDLDLPGHVLLPEDVVGPNPSLGVESGLVDLEEIDLGRVLCWGNMSAHVLSTIVSWGTFPDVPER